MQPLLRVLPSSLTLGNLGKGGGTLLIVVERSYAVQRVPEVKAAFGDYVIVKWRRGELGVN